MFCAISAPLPLLQFYCKFVLCKNGPRRDRPLHGEAYSVISIFVEVRGREEGRMGGREEGEERNIKYDE